MRHISPRGRALVTACFVAGGALLTGAPEGGEGAGWIAMLIAAAVGVLVCLCLGELGKKSPEQDFYAATADVLGRGWGGAAAAIIGLLALCMAVRDIGVITQFIGANMITETPRWLITAAMAAVTAWCAAEGRSTVGRWTELAAALAGGTLLLALVLAAGDFDIRAVAEGVRDGAEGIPVGIEGLFAQCTGAVLLCGAALFPFGGEEKRRWLPLTVGLLIGSGVLAVVLMMNVALLGADTLGMFNFPTYHALRISGISGILERMEALLVFPAVATSFLRIAVEIVAMAGAVEYFKPSLAGRKLPSFVIGGVAAALSVGLLQNQTALGAAEAAWSVWYAAVLAVVTAVIGCAAAIKRR